MKRVMIVSNNPMRADNNNGATVASFFLDYPEECLSQIFIEENYPDFIIDCSYYRIADNEVLDSVMHKSKSPGQEIKKDNIVQKVHSNKSVGQSMTVKRILREILWKFNTWKNGDFENWINKQKPEVVFFYAGDSGFMYDVVEYIISHSKAKLVLYISDDYILPRKKENILEHWRRKYIKKRMTSAVEMCEKMFVISEKMRREYKKIFKKDSQLLMNLALKQEDVSEKKAENSNRIKFLYCGNLEYGREESLMRIAKAIEKNNQCFNKKAILDVYSAQETIGERFNIVDVSNYGGMISKDQVREKIQSSDVLIHVESLSEKNMEKTRLSISTKIAEYLCYEKAILAVGSKDLASIEALENVACVVSDLNDLDETINKLINDAEYRKKLSFLTIQLYKHYQEIMPRDIVIKTINEL